MEPAGRVLLVVAAVVVGAGARVRPEQHSSDVEVNQSRPRSLRWSRVVTLASPCIRESTA